MSGVIGWKQADWGSKNESLNRWMYSCSSKLDAINKSWKSFLIPIFANSKLAADFLWTLHSMPENQY